MSVKGREGRIRGFPICRSSVVFRASRGFVERGKRECLGDRGWSLSVLGRARLVGEQSFGRAPFRRFFPQRRGWPRLTTAMYFLPDGSTIHEQGIEPDFLVPCSEANETKLRIQRYGDPSLSSREFEELFGFTRVRDVQKTKAFDLLTVESNSTGRQ